MKIKSVLLVLGVSCLMSGCTGKKYEVSNVPVREIESEVLAESDVEVSEVVSEIESNSGVDNSEESESEINSLEESESEMSIDKEVVYNSNMLELGIKKSSELIDSQGNQSANIMVSSLSLDLALALAMNGSDGQTLSQLEDYLGVPMDTYNQYASSLMSNLPDVFSVANSLWFNSEMSFKDEYIKNMKSDYNADIESIDCSDSFGSASKVNTWVDNSTNGMIPSLIDESSITKDTSAILVNAICFDDKWGSKFDSVLESDEFSNIDDSVSYVKMMYATYDGQYYENEDMMAFIKPYETDRYKFIGIVPKSELSLIDKSVSELGIEDLLVDSNLKSNSSIHIKLPEFDFDYTVNGISETLKSNGVVDAFSDKANFSKMSDECTYFSDVIQKTKITVDENGTKAAAATGIVMRTTALAIDPNPPVEIFCDRPFVFVIYDSDTNTVMFMGKVVKL